MKLGEFIREVKEIVDYTKDIPIKGLSNKKCFIKSHSNLNDVKSKFKIVRKNYFCYNPNTARNGDKISIALQDKYEKIIISNSYITFEIINEEILNSEFLMLWFMRENFDKLVRFKSSGSAREVFSFEKMCSLEISIPDMEIQKQIVRDYETTRLLIENKQKINNLLEEWMSCYFHILFDNLKEWTTKTIDEIGNVLNGATPARSQNKYWCKNGISWLLQGDLTSSIFKFGFKGVDDITEEGYNSCSTKLVPEGTILFPRIGPYNKIYIAGKELCFSSELRGIVLENKKNQQWVYFFLKENHLNVEGQSSGTVFGSVSGKILKKVKILLPPESIINQFNKVCEPIFEFQKNNEQEIRELMNFQNSLIEYLN